jgi:hypothetical protein
MNLRWARWRRCAWRNRSRSDCRRRWAARRIRCGVTWRRSSSSSANWRWPSFSRRRHPGKVRWRDALLAAENAGVNALPIVALISFLLGFIMAFQSAVPMRQFGVEIFVADLVALSMLRELGPLMTAIILAGTIRLGVCGGDRDDEGQRGDQRAHDDGPGPGALSSWSRG